MLDEQNIVNVEQQMPCITVIILDTFRLTISCSMSKEKCKHCCQKQLLQRESLMAKDALYFDSYCLKHVCRYKVRCVYRYWKAEKLSRSVTALIAVVERSDSCPLQKDFLPKYKRACDIRNWSSAGRWEQAVLLCLSFLFEIAVQHTWIKAKGCVCGCSLYHLFF